MLGELYSAAFTGPAFNWLCSPAVTELETVVLDWLARLLNLPECYLSEGEGGGVIQGSASETVVTVMVAARERYLNAACQGLEGEEMEEKKAKVRGRLVALGSEQSHSSIAKAAIIAGVRYKSISTRMEDDLAMTGEGLRATLEECKRENLEPFFLSTTLGTTATCAIDRFSEIAHLASTSYPKLWIHVDAAYAGAALVCEEYQNLTAPFSAFDSFNINMHKWLLTAFDASCLYIKRRRELTDALSIMPSYLRNDYSDKGLVTDYRDWQIPLGRRFRSLKIWFVLRTYGVNGLKEHIRNHIRLGEMFHGLVKSRPDLFKVLAPPAFALTVLTVVPPENGSGKPEPNSRLTNGEVEGSAHVKAPLGETEIIKCPVTEDQANVLTQDVYERINAEGKIFLTSSVIEGVYAIRVVSANPKADEEHLRRAFEILVNTTELVLSSTKN